MLEHRQASMKWMMVVSKRVFVFLLDKVYILVEWMIFQNLPSVKNSLDLVGVGGDIYG